MDEERKDEYEFLKETIKAKPIDKKTGETDRMPGWG